MQKVAVKVTKVVCSAYYLRHGTEQLGQGGRERGRGSAQFESFPHSGQKVGVEKQVLKQFIDVLMKEAIVVTLGPGQHRMGEAGRGEGGSLVKTIFINSSISYCIQSLCLIHVHI